MLSLSYCPVLSRKPGKPISPRKVRRGCKKIASTHVHTWIIGKRISLQVTGERNQCVIVMWQNPSCGWWYSPRLATGAILQVFAGISPGKQRFRQLLICSCWNCSSAGATNNSRFFSTQNKISCSLRCWCNYVWTTM